MCQCQCLFVFPFVGAWWIPLEYGKEVLNNLSYDFVITDIASAKFKDSLSDISIIFFWVFFGAIITSKGHIAQKGVNTTKSSFSKIILSFESCSCFI